MKKRTKQSIEGDSTQREKEYIGILVEAVMVAVHSPAHLLGDARSKVRELLLELSTQALSDACDDVISLAYVLHHRGESKTARWLLELLEEAVDGDSQRSGDSFARGNARRSGLATLDLAHSCEVRRRGR